MTRPTYPSSSSATARCLSSAWAPGLTTDIASSTRTGTFDITRTTGTPSGRRASMKDVRMPAANEMTRCSGVMVRPTWSRSPSMSWGFTVSTSVRAQLAASSLESVAATS
jgi:hypothetical protein